MGIHWTSKVKIIFFLAPLSLLSCKSQKAVTIDKVETRNRTEIVTTRNPFKLESISDVKVDSFSVTIPSTSKLVIGKTTSEVFIKNNKVVHILENKDTVVTSRDIKDIQIKDTVVTNTTSKELNWWQRLKKKVNTIAIYVLIVNVLFLGYKLTRWIRRVSFPI